MNKKRKTKARFWFRLVTTECPVCGRGKSCRERVYGKRPKEPSKCYVYEELYDYCIEHGAIS